MSNKNQQYHLLGHTLKQYPMHQFLISECRGGYLCLFVLQSKIHMKTLSNRRKKNTDKQIQQKISQQCIHEAFSNIAEITAQQNLLEISNQEEVYQHDAFESNKQSSGILMPNIQSRQHNSASLKKYLTMPSERKIYQKPFSNQRCCRNKNVSKEAKTECEEFMKELRSKTVFIAKIVQPPVVNYSRFILFDERKQESVSVTSKPKLGKYKTMFRTLYYKNSRSDSRERINNNIGSIEDVKQQRSLTKHGLFRQKSQKSKILQILPDFADTLAKMTNKKCESPRHKKIF